MLFLFASARLCFAAEDLFTSGRVPHLKIEIAKTNMDSLRRDARKYVPVIVRDGDTVYTNVAVHLKGAAGSFRQVDDRPALTLNFDKYVEHQKFQGFDKIHLNNSVQDPSYMTELICGELFVAAGVPAARTTHAHVELNGRDLGLYVLKEGFNQTFLRRFFKNTKGNLYDGGFLREITEDLEKDSGDDVKDHSDLKALARAAQEPDPSARMAALEKVLDMERFISFMALEAIVWDWDGYPMKHNNYRVYHDLDSAKMIFFPHGMDQMFWEPQGTIFPNFEGLVAHAIISTSEGRRRYRERLGTVMTNVYDVAKITNRIAEVHARIRPIVGKRLDGTIVDLRNHIVARHDSVAQQLAIPEPKPLAFASGEAAISGWRPKMEMGQAQLLQDQDGMKIKIVRTGPTVASWRAKVLLEPGGYRLTTRAQSNEIAPVRDSKGEGAGIRISGTQQPRGNKVVGTSPWKDLAFDFTAPGGEIELVCELRATRGEVIFAVPSLKLSRK